MARYMANEAKSTFWMDVLKISLGVFIGGLLSALAYTKIIALGVEYAAAEVSAAIKLDLQKMDAKSEQARKQAELARLRQVAQQQAEQQAANERAAQQAEQMLQREVRMRAEWQQIYQPSAACRIDSTTMPCVNAYASAHKRFMDKFGEMPPRF